MKTIDCKSINIASPFITEYLNKELWEAYKKSRMKGISTYVMYYYGKEKKFWGYKIESSKMEDKNLQYLLRFQESEIDGAVRASFYTVEELIDWLKEDKL